MWNVESIRSRRTRFDFTSSEQGQRDVVQVLFDDVTFANAVELTGWGNKPFQVFVCEQCGYEGCASGNWLTLRRVSDFVTFVPAFEYMESDEEGVDHSPPSYILERGAPKLTRQLYEELRDMVVALPRIDAIAHLSCRDAALLLKAEAPARIMGRPCEEPVLNRKLIVAVSDGDLNERIRQFEALVATALASDDVEVEALDASLSTAVTFYLDVPGFTEWTPMVSHDDAAWIRLEPGVNLTIPTSGAEP